MDIFYPKPRSKVSPISCMLKVWSPADSNQRLENRYLQLYLVLSLTYKMYFNNWLAQSQNYLTRWLAIYINVSYAWQYHNLHCKQSYKVFCQVSLHLILINYHVNVLQAEIFLTLVKQFKELGFTQDKIQDALVNTNLDRDKALDYLTA